jgi:protein gp37
VLFVSVEPMLGPVDFGWAVYAKLLRGGENYRQVNWIVVGSMTGPGAVKPEPEWVLGLEKQCQAASIPIFEKGNLYPGPLKYPVFIREWPHA